MQSDAIKRVHQALEEIAAGNMVIMVDDEERENEGDLVMAADKVTPDAINFMARFGRGLICMPMSPEKVDALQLPLMNETYNGRRSTAFTVSIEARLGVTTGISAADRARTVAVAAAPGAKPSDLASPGHIFPLRAVPGGVLQRAGHTEGSVDLARLAGLSPAGVICEIMNDDGTMSRMADLEKMAAVHGLHILSIADLIQYRLQTESLVRRVQQVDLALPPGHALWQAHVYETAAAHGQNQMLALTLGKLDDSPTLVRVQVGNTLTDVFGALTRSRVTVSEAIGHIEAEGRGAILFIPSRRSLLDEMTEFAGERASKPPQEAVLRETGLGAQVLFDLGLRKLRLLTRHASRVVAATGYGVEVVEQVILPGPKPLS